MKLALDENLPPALARAIHELLLPFGGEASCIPERFGRGVADRDWIAALRDEGGWAVLTLDRKLRTRPHERLALEQSGLVVFILAAGWAKESFWPKTTGIICWLPRMLEAIEVYRAPVLLAVPHRLAPRTIRTFSGS